MKRFITNTYRKRVIKLFYRTTLRSGEDVIDNRDGSIAKELGINTGIVHAILQREMKEKAAKAGQNFINEEKEIEEMEVNYVEIKPHIKKKKVKLIPEPNFYFNP
jgi:hypothetical protein